MYMQVVIDTGVVVSGLIRKAGTPGNVLRLLRDGLYSVVFSADMLVELIEVLSRSQFRTKYHIEPEDIRAIIHLLRFRGELVIPTVHVELCRDVKDNKFLDAALAGGVDALVTRDQDLLVLKQIEQIPIIRPIEFLSWL
jgi:putative PIN family toxin of toxin-antitoxin system